MKYQEKDVFSVAFGEMALFVIIFVLLLFCQLASNSWKKAWQDGNAKKRITFSCCPVLESPSLFPVDVVQNNCILSCSVLHEVELAFSGFASSISLLYKLN